MCCKRYHINFSTFSSKFKCKVCVQIEVIHIFFTKSHFGHVTNYELTHFKKTVPVWKTKWLLFCLRYEPLIVFRRQNHITFIFIETMSHDFLVQMACYHLGNEKLTTWVLRLSFAVIEILTLSQLLCGHFAGANQNGQTNKVPAKTLGSRNNVWLVVLYRNLHARRISLESRDLSAFTRLQKAERSSLANALMPISKLRRWFFCF